MDSKAPDWIVKLECLAQSACSSTTVFLDAHLIPAFGTVDGDPEDVDSGLQRDRNLEIV